MPVALATAVSLILILHSCHGAADRCTYFGFVEAFQSLIQSRCGFAAHFVCALQINLSNV